MQTFLSRSIALAPFFLSAILLPLVSQAAFGISPPFLNADHLVAGAKFSQTVYLVQDQPNQDLRIKADLNVPDAIKSWIHIDKGMEFVIPSGTRQFPVQIEVDVPSGAGLGQYSGNLAFVNVPSQAGQQVTIALGANVAINLTVGNDIFEKFSVPIVKSLDIEEGWNPRVDVKFENEGNIPESFDNATFELYDRYGGTRLAYIEKNSDFPQTPPFATNEYTLEFPTNFHLGLGQYWAGVSLLKGGKVVASNRTIFSVVPAGSLSGPGTQIFNYLKNYWPYGAAVILVLLVAVGLVLKRRRRA